MQPLRPGEPWDAAYAVNQRYKPQPIEGPSGGRPVQCAARRGVTRAGGGVQWRARPKWGCPFPLTLLSPFGFLSPNAC